MEKQLFVLLAVSALLLGCAGQASQSDNSTNRTGGIIMKIDNSSNATLGAKAGDIVQVDYTGTFDNGTVFDTSLKSEAEKAGLPLRPSYEPLKFTVGMGQMIKGFDEAVVGMKEGEVKMIHLKPSEAYGEYRQDLVGDIPIANVPPDTKAGSELVSGNGMRGMVVSVNKDNVTIDFNHPMAGKALNFRIVMIKIART